MSDIKTREEVLVDGDDFYISLSKLTGKNIVDIHGYVSDPYGGGTSFGISKIVFDDGTDVHVEGEHDWAYIYDIDEKQLEAARDKRYDDDEDEDEE